IKRPGETDWIKAKVNPLLEEITLKTPESLSAGKSAEIEAVGSQPGNINIPLRYPASVVWTGSENVFVGDSEEAAEAIETGNHDAVFDYTTGTLTALKQGEITLHVKSNDVEAEAEITIQ